MKDNDKFLLISMDDERAKKLSEVLGSKTCKKIIDFLAETKEASEKDIADELKIPLNTTEYNLKKLVHAELVEKTKNFFWSKKGKKIPMYKLSNKSIIISPKSKVSSKIKSILPVAIFAGLGSLIIRQLTTFQSQNQVFQTGEKMLEAAPEATNIMVDNADFFFTQPPTAWMWFLGGAILATIIFAILNWRKI